MDMVLLGVFTVILMGIIWIIRTPEAPQVQPVEVSSPTFVDPVEVVPLAPLKVYKPEAKQKTALGKGIKADPKKHLVGTTKAERDEKPVEVSTVLDERTGDFTTVVTQLPSPWLSAPQRTEVFAEYGIRSPDHKMIARLGVNHQVFKVKDVALGVTAQVDSEKESFVGARVSYRW